MTHFDLLNKANRVQGQSQVDHSVGSHPAQDPVSSITLEVARKYINSLKSYSASTERVYTYALYGFFDDLNASADTSGFNVDMYQSRGFGRKRLRNVPKRLPLFPEEKIESMIAYVEELANELSQDSQDDLHQLRTIALVLTLADTGLRVHEVCKLRRGDLDTKTLKAVVIGKGDKQALVRFSSRSAEAIQAYLRSRQAIDGASGKRLDNIPIFVGHDGRGLKYLNPMSTNTGRAIIAEVSESLFGEEAKGQVTPIHSATIL